MFYHSQEMATGCLASQQFLGSSSASFLNAHAQVLRHGVRVQYLLVVAQYHFQAARLLKQR